MSGFSFTPAESFGHLANPQTGSYVRENGGGPANPLLSEDYPIRAVCRVRGGRIRLGSRLQMEWRHQSAIATGDAS